MNKHLGKIMFVLALGLILISCERNGQHADLEQHISQLKEQKKQKQREMPPPTVIKSPKPATYTAKSLRSPFSTADVVSQVKPTTSTNPLQAYGLNMLRFVGTIQKERGTYAYVLTPDNTVFQVKEGDVIGDHGGKVFKITADRLEIREAEAVREGVVMQRIITLQLKGH